MLTFESILQSNLSPDKPTRDNAYAILEQQFSTNLQETVFNLLQSMRSGNPHTAQAGALLLRRKVLIEKLYLQLSPESMTQVKQEIFSLIHPNMKFLLNILGDLVLALALINDSQQELIGYIEAWIQSSEPDIKSLAIYMFETTSQYDSFRPYYIENANKVMGYLHSFLCHTNMDIRLKAVNSAASLLGSFNSETVQQYQGATEFFINTIQTALESQEHDVAKTLCYIQELTSKHPEIWAQRLQSIIHLLCMIMKRKNSDIGLRTAGSNALVCFIEQLPELIKADQYSVQEILSTGFECMSHDSSFKDLQVWDQKLVKDCIVEGPQDIGRDVLQKLALYVQDGVVFYIPQLIQAHIDSPDIVRQYAGLLSIDIFANYLDQWISLNIEHIAGQLMRFIANPDPRIVYAAVRSLRTIFNRCAPLPHIQYHFSVLPAIFHLIRGYNSNRVKYQCLKFIESYTIFCINFNKYKAQVYDPYIQQITTHLLEVLQYSITNLVCPLISSAIISLKCLCNITGLDFSPYYQSFVPLLKQLALAQVKGPEQLDVRAEAISCLGHITSISGKQFPEQTQQLIQDLILLHQQVSEEDPATKCIVEVIPYFSRVMSQVPDWFISWILQTISKDIDRGFIDVDDPSHAHPSDNALLIHSPGQGQGVVFFNNHQLENKIVACEALYDLSRWCKFDLGQYAENVLRVLCPQMNSIYSQALLKIVGKTIPEIMLCHPCPEQTLQFVIQHYIEALQASKKVFRMKQTISSLEKVLGLDINIAALGIGTAGLLSNTLAEFVRKIFYRKVQKQPKLAKFSQDKVLYASQIETFKEKEKADNRMLSHVMECLSALEFTPIFLQNFKNLFGEVLYYDSCTQMELEIAINIFDDYIEHSGNLLEMEGRLFVLEKMLTACYAKKPGLRQAAVYGVGLFAKMANREVFGQYLQHAMNAVQYILTLPEAHESSCISCTECAIGALGRLALYQNQQLLETWVGNLPVRGDKDEAVMNHKMLLENLQFIQQVVDCGKVIRELGELWKQEEEVLDEEGVRMLQLVSCQQNQ